LVTVSFITSGLNVNMLYWCFSYGTDDGILNVGWLHWKQLLKIQVDKSTVLKFVTQLTIV
jgi:hypothetical protein